ncbi:MAG: TlpA family protein disulfide reductase [Bacteroidia bacterium]|nr:TlpA family protein disulfide reductase [Bacteroidia bacterium]
MKKYLLLLPILALMACSDSTTKKEVSEENAKEEAQVEQASLRTISNGTPVYNYSELEPMLQKEDGTTYVINFWATWCKPCVEELPYFEQLTETYKGDQVKVVLVSLDFEKQFEKKLVPFMQKHDLQSEVVVLLDPDSNSWIDKVNQDWSGAIPATIIYNGAQREFREGSYASFEELQDIIKTYL